MTFWGKVLEIFDMRMETPAPFGWFHLLFFTLSVILAIILCKTYRKDKPDTVRKVIFLTSVLVLILEIYKQINFSFTYSDGTVVFDFLWYAFPWQFCSMPMYVGLLTGLTKKGKIHDSLFAFLATYSIFGGLCVMLYPVQIFVPQIGINIQTMICHGSMLTIGIYLMYTGYVKTEHKTILKAFPVFACAVFLASLFNEIAYFSGLLETDTFNMFYISPYCDPSLPVYSLVQGIVPYPWCLVIYIVVFTLAAYIVLLIAMGIKKLCEHIFSKHKKA